MHIFRYVSLQQRVCMSMVYICGAVPGTKQYQNLWIHHPNKHVWHSLWCTSHAVKSQTKPINKTPPRQQRSTPVLCMPLEFLLENQYLKWRSRKKEFLPTDGHFVDCRLQSEIINYFPPMRLQTFVLLIELFKLMIFLTTPFCC